MVRDDGPETHWSKRGVPTMGGLLVLAGMGAAVLLWCDLRNGLVWLLLAISVFYAGIGAPPKKMQCQEYVLRKRE